MIYWDNNATTPVAEEVLEAMLPYFRDQFYNPSAAYRPAGEIRRALGDARERVAALVGAHPSEILFTSGGTEATNAALSQFRKLVVPATEHPATLRSAGERGVICAVLANGQVDIPHWKECLPGCDGASFAWANHETGVLQPGRSLASAARAFGARVHVDLVQAAGKVPLCLEELPVDFASLSAHKIHGPKGVGALYVRTGVEFRPCMLGGGQEEHRRAGTENVPAIVGFGKAAELALSALESYAGLAVLRERFVDILRESGVAVVVNALSAPRLPHVLNMRIPGCMAESLFLLLEPAGLICSTGSACTSAEPEPSHVLRAMGLPDTHIRESMRLSLSRYSTAREVEEAASLVVHAVRKLRSVQSAVTGPVVVYR